MSQYTVVDDDLPAEVASNTGWGQFTDWVNGLDVNGLEELHHLAAYGWSQDVKPLAEQLAKAIKEGNPSPDVTDVGETLLAQIRDGGDVVTITNGMSADDDEPTDLRDKPTPPQLGAKALGDGSPHQDAQRPGVTK
jgi:hypothetical protein